MSTRLQVVCRARTLVAGSALSWGLLGCASAPDPIASPAYPGRSMKQVGVASSNPSPAVRQAAHQEPAAPPQPAGPAKPVPAAAPAPVQVDELVQLAVGSNPRLGKANFAIEAARGRYVQAGLYPNPNLAANWDEIGDRTGPGGILNVPRITQEIVTGRKLSLSQAVVAREVDQSTLDLMKERYALVGAVRAAFYDLYALERRIVVLDELQRVAGDAVKTGQTLLDNKQIARLDLVQLEVELARFRSQAEAARQELAGARRRLAAVVGDPRLPVGTTTGPYEEVPTYDEERTLDTVLASHPEAQSARVGVDRAQAAVRRAEVEPIPNLTFTTGYIRQYENRSNDFALGLSAPIPLWNRNQGNIRAAKAELGVAVQEVARVQNDLAERVATALRSYSAARKLAEQYRTDILPKAEETYKLSLEAFKGGQFEYLRVIQAQRAVAEARLEYNRALGDSWRAAAELSALLLEEWWPGTPPAPALPANPAAGQKPR
jgi:cobalt-zinc-cadmium efflux system outer membrane protein